MLEETDAVFDGYSFNGPPLMKTLESFDAAKAAMNDTFEGYTAWGIALHVMYWKYEFAKMIGDEMPEPFPYHAGNWPALPADGSAVAWQETLARLRKVNAVLRERIAALDTAKLDEIIPDWKVTVERGLMWVIGHDTYHTAQIRSMGIPGTEGEK